MKITLRLAMALIITLSVVSLAMARGTGPQHAEHGERGQFRGQDCPVLSSLTEEQQHELRKLAREHREWMYPQKQMMTAKQAELNALLATEGSDPSEIEKIRHQLSTLNQKIYDRKLTHTISMNQKFNLKTRMQGRAFGSKKHYQTTRKPGRDCPRVTR